MAFQEFHSALDRCGGRSQPVDKFRRSVIYELTVAVFLPSLLGGDHEGDSPNGVGPRGRERGGRGEGRGCGPGRDVEVRLRDRRPAAYVHPDDQEGRGQVRRDDELAGPEGDETHRCEAKGRRVDLLRSAGGYG